MTGISRRLEGTGAEVEYSPGDECCFLIGVLVVVATLGSLPWISDRRHGDRYSMPVIARTEMCAILAALAEYSIEHRGSYPTSLTPLVVPDSNGQCYLAGFDGKIPRDPWGHEYHYEPPTPSRVVPHVWSSGADGLPGGEGDEADIDSDLLASER